MPLVNCRECRHVVSAQARSCPSCGIRSPARARFTKWQKVGIAIGLLATMLVCLLFLGSLQPPPAPDTRTATEKAETMDAMKAVLELRKSMRNPRSFELRLAFLVSGGWGCYVYMAQNGFGGVNRDIAISRGETPVAGGAAMQDWKQHCTKGDGRNETNRMKLLLQEVAIQ